MQIRYAFVDAVRERPLAGNPVAIVPHAEALDEPTMRRIAESSIRSRRHSFFRPKMISRGLELEIFHCSGPRSLRSRTQFAQRVVVAGRVRKSYAGRRPQSLHAGDWRRAFACGSSLPAQPTCHGCPYSYVSCIRSRLRGSSEACRCTWNKG